MTNEQRAARAALQCFELDNRPGLLEQYKAIVLAALNEAEPPQVDGVAIADARYVLAWLLQCHESQHVCFSLPYNIRQLSERALEKLPAPPAPPAEPEYVPRCGDWFYYRMKVGDWSWDGPLKSTGIYNNHVQEESHALDVEKYEFAPCEVSSPPADGGAK